MRQKIFVLLTVSAVLTMALAGCAQTDDRTYEQSAEVVRIRQLLLQSRPKKNRKALKIRFPQMQMSRLFI